MDNNVQTETNDLHQMVQNWKKFWLTQYSTDGVNEWIYEEFVEEITVHIVPYIGRLFETSHLTKIECGNFYERLRGEITDMRRLLRLPTTPKGTLESS